MDNDSSIEFQPATRPAHENAAICAPGNAVDDALRAQVLYQSLFELMPGSVVLMDANGVILDVNPAFCRQIGYGRDELRGRHVSLFSKDSGETIDQNLTRLLAGEVLEHDVTNVHRDGSLRHYELRETAITLPDGSRGILALSNDITPRVRAEKEKLEMQREFLHTEKLKSLGLMAGGVAHDFNNLLTVIIGNIELGLMESGGPATGGPFREAINAANRAAHLTRQMLAYSGRERFNIVDVDVNEVIRRTAELLNITISKKASLELRLGLDLPLIEGDAAQLQQIFMNLVTNASEALGDNPGLITATTFVRDYDAAGLAPNRTGNPLKPGRYVVLEVKDTGCGMDESVQQRLFDPFFSTKFTGRGLGMSAVLGTVRAHDGGIFVTSGVGRGATVSVLFPPGSPRSVGATSTSAKSGLGNNLPQISGSVLVADGEAITRLMVERLLQRTGLRVFTAADGIEAIGRFKRHSDEITFVMLDLSLPKLDGIQTLAELRQLRPDVKAILTSGINETGVNERSRQLGFVAFVAKPYQAGVLFDLASQICARQL